jgi:hypothetical protein
MGLDRTHVTQIGDLYRPGDQRWLPRSGVGDTDPQQQAAQLQSTYLTPADKINPTTVQVDDGTAGGAKLLAGVDPARSQLWVRNPGTAGGTLWVGDADVVADEKGWPLFPGEGMVFGRSEFKGELYGVYDAGVSGPVYVAKPAPGG